MHYMPSYIHEPISWHQRDAMTLLEVIIVIALLAGLMSYAVPSLFREDDHSFFFRQLQMEVKSAFDTSVLTSTPHRLVINIAKRSVHLETIAAPSPQVPTSYAVAPLSQENRKEMEVRVERWLEDAPKEVKDFEKDRVIPASSPLIKAKDRLVGAAWKKVEGFGHEPFRWSKDLYLSLFYVEHMTEQVSLDEGRGGLDKQPIYIHFFPHGYVEKATLVYKELEADRPPYVINVLSRQGVAQLSSRQEDAQMYQDL